MIFLDRHYKMDQHHQLDLKGMIGSCFKDEFDFPFNVRAKNGYQTISIHNWNLSGQIVALPVILATNVMSEMRYTVLDMQFYVVSLLICHSCIHAVSFTLSFKVPFTFLQMWLGIDK